MRKAVRPANGIGDDGGGTKGGASLRKALNLLCAVGEAPQGIAAKALIAQSGLTRPTAYRMIAVLVEEGFLTQEEPDNTVSLGPQFLQLAQHVWSDRDLRRTAKAELQTLSDTTGAEAMLLVRSHSMMSCVDVVAPDQSGAHRLGTVEPIVQSAGGQALLAFGHWGGIDDELREMSETDLDERTLRDLKSKLAVVRSRFYAVAQDETAVEVAAPIFDVASNPIAAVTLRLAHPGDAGPSVHELGAAVVQTAQRISRMRGGYPFGVDVPNHLAVSSDPTVERLVDAQCLIGDSPSVDPKTGAVTWIDILAPAIHRLHQDSGRHEIVACQEVVGAAIATADGGLLVAEQTRLRQLDADLNEIARYASTLPPGFRFNDGARDARGRFWLGAMDMAVSRGTGFLLRFETLDRPPVIIPGFSLPNGIGFSSDGARMYVIDSMERSLSTFAYDPRSGEVDLQSRIALLDGEGGRPSGLVVDDQGTLITCHWDGGAVVALSEDGSVVARHVMPVPRPSGLAYDPARQELVITSARVRMSEGDLARFPASGSVYRMHLSR